MKSKNFVRDHKIIVKSVLCFLYKVNCNMIYLKSLIALSKCIGVSSDFSLSKAEVVVTRNHHQTLFGVGSSAKKMRGLRVFQLSSGFCHAIFSSNYAYL